MTKRWVPSVGTEVQIAYNKKKNNKSIRRTLLFGCFVAFVMSVPAERPKRCPGKGTKIFMGAE